MFAVGIVGAVGAITVANAALPNGNYAPAIAAPVTAPVAQPAPVVATAPTAPAQPQFVFSDPLPGFHVGSPFGLREMPWEDHGRLHEGVDIPAPSGHPVHATMAGVVTAAGDSPSYGRFVEIRHASGLTSKYAHLRGLARRLRVGQTIEGGQILGYVGDTGHSTGPHLHFEIREKGRPLNPALFMDHSFRTAAELPLRPAGRPTRRQARTAYAMNVPAGFTREPAGIRRVHAVLKLRG